MSVHPVTEAFPHNTTVSADTIRQKLGSTFPLVLLTPGDITSMDFSQSNAVAVPNAIVAKVSGLAVLFLYDAADMSSVHNGTTVLVSSDGKRYKSALAPGYFVNVLERTNTPPGSPATGDRYIVGASPSGAWSSNADDLTIYDGADWVFVSPEIGQTVYVRAVEGQMHWGESGDWLEGAGSFSVDAESITARELAFPWGMVVEEETATPPAGTPAAGTKYIVGTSATGAWASHDTEIADADGAGGWVFYTPYDGAQVLNRDIKSPMRFDGDAGVWISSGGAWVGRAPGTFTAAEASGLTSSGSTAYAYSVTTAPTTTNRRTKDPVTRTYTAKKSGATLRVIYDADVTTWGAGGVASVSHVSSNTKGTIALFRDSETDAIAWRTGGYIYPDDLPDHLSAIFYITALDAAEHTYTIAFMGSFQEGGAADVPRFPTAIARRLLTIEEAA